jgi:hypothetical protein
MCSVIKAWYDSRIKPIHMKQLPRRVRRFWHWPAHQRAAFVRALVYLTLVDLGLRLLSFRRVIGRAQRPLGPAGQPTAPDVARAQQYAAWLFYASRFHPAQPQCLHRSLALHFWLRHDHLPSEVRIGVKKAAGTLAAHAWVECGGQVIDDAPDAVQSFTLIHRASPTAAAH